LYITKKSHLTGHVAEKEIRRERKGKPACWPRQTWHGFDGWCLREVCTQDNTVTSQDKIPRTFNTSHNLKTPINSTFTIQSYLENLHSDQNKFLQQKTQCKTCCLQRKHQKHETLQICFDKIFMVPEKLPMVSHLLLITKN